MAGVIEAVRYHDISVGHRVCRHESKCANLHGHNYRIHFVVQQENPESVDAVGRVLDFSVIKSKLCMWLENHWDHKFLIWERDPLATILKKADSTVIWSSFNPTAENMAKFLVQIVGPEQLLGTGCVLVAVKVEETAKCAATYSLQTVNSGE